MMVQLVFVIMKTFKYLKIYDDFSPLIQMIQKVLWKLFPFLFMQFINIIFFTIVLTVL